MLASPVRLSEDPIVETVVSQIQLETRTIFTSGGPTAGEELIVDGLVAELRQLSDLLSRASARIGRPIYILSDEPYARIVFDGLRPISPAEFYPNTLIAYSYGKVLLTPGQFFPALASDDFVDLYTLGLRQTLIQRNRWLEGGLDLHVSINMPSSALADVRYFGSQPWPFPHSLMIGFTAQWAGGELKPDAVEIVAADWFGVDAMPVVPGRLSISRALIEDFVRGQGGDPAALRSP